MPTDLRAALREAIHTLTKYTSGTRTDATIAELRSIADVPPTVAELLPMVDATHEVRWTSRSGTLCRCLLDDRGGIRAFAVERQGSSGRWLADLLRPSDLTQPARLVEVTP